MAVEANFANVPASSRQWPEVERCSKLARSEPASGTLSPSASQNDCSESIVIGEYTVFMEAGSSSLRAVDSAGRRLRCRVHAQHVRDNLLEVHRRLALSNCQHVSPLVAALVHHDRLYAFYEPAFGDLHALIRERVCLPEDAAAAYYRQIVQLVLDAHAAGIVVRDLRLRNIVFGDAARTHLLVDSLVDCVCLEDATNDAVHNTQQTCPSYISPEMLEAAKKNLTYPGRASDCWVLGIILYTLLVGQYPFYDKELHCLFQRVQSSFYCIPPHVSSAARSLIRALLRRDTAERLTVMQILNHPWLTQTNAMQLRNNCATMTLQLSSVNTTLRVSNWSEAATGSQTGLYLGAGPQIESPMAHRPAAYTNRNDAQSQNWLLQRAGVGGEPLRAPVDYATSHSNRDEANLRQSTTYTRFDAYQYPYHHRKTPSE